VFFCGPCGAGFCSGVSLSADFISSVRNTHAAGILHANARALFRYTPFDTTPSSTAVVPVAEDALLCFEEEEDCAETTVEKLQAMAIATHRFGERPLLIQ
jgi:hypothetical protein